MTASLDRAAYSDCYDLFDLALQSDFGVEMSFKSYGHAMNYRLRMNRARQLDREISTRIHDKDHPEYAKSKYSVFTIRIEKVDGEWMLKIERNVLPTGAVRALPAPDGWDFEEMSDGTEGAS
jgi:hypothetical protein